MTGRLQHARCEVADLDGRAFLHAFVHKSDSRCFVVWRDDAAIVFALEIGNAADMVGMVVSDQNIGQRPTFTLQRLDDRPCFRRVDRGRRLRRRVMN